MDFAELTDPSDWGEFVDLREFDRLLRCTICYEYFTTAMDIQGCSHTCKFIRWNNVLHSHPDLDINDLHILQSAHFALDDISRKIINALHVHRLGFVYCFMPLCCIMKLTDFLISQHNVGASSLVNNRLVDELVNRFKIVR